MSPCLREKKSLDKKSVQVRMNGADELMVLDHNHGPSHTTTHLHIRSTHVHMQATYIHTYIHTQTHTQTHTGKWKRAEKGDYLGPVGQLETSHEHPFDPCLAHF